MTAPDAGLGGMEGTEMEIKTTQKRQQPEVSDQPAAGEKNRYLRRKEGQKLARSRSTARRIVALLALGVKIGSLLLLLGSLYALVHYAYTSDQFAVREIRFHGAAHAQVPRLEALVRTGFPRNILMIDLRQLCRRMESADPWIRRVEVRRILPSDLEIYLTERIPAAVVELQGELMLADEEGILLAQYGSDYPKMDVPVLKGFLGRNAGGYRTNQEENSARLRLGLAMLAEIEGGSPLLTRNISEVDLSDKDNVRLLLVGDTAEILLGDHDFLKRFQTLLSNMKQYQDIKEQYREIVSVDLRYEGQIIYRPLRTENAQAAAALMPDASR